MNVAVIVLTWNAADAALACLRTLAAQERVPDYTLVVDNASQDGTAERIRQEFPAITVIRNTKNLGFGVGMNIGIQTLHRLSEPPEVVVLLNQDTLLEPSWLNAILAPLDNDARTGAVGCKIRYPDKTLQHAGTYLEWPRSVAHHIGRGETDTGQYDDVQEYDAVTGAAIAIRMQAMREVGLFDPGYTPAYYEDIDLCWRLRKQGYRIVYAPQAVLTHHESLSMTDPITRGKYYNRGRLRFVLKSYAIDHILQDFATSEQQFIQQHIYPPEARALRWAYVETYHRLDEICQARSVIAQERLDAQTVDNLGTMILECKHCLTRALHRRAHATLEAMRFYEPESDTVL